MIYTMTLNPALDYVMHPLTLDMGFTNRSSSEELHCGGNGINISTLLNELDVPSIAMGIAAGFTGDYLLRRLQEKGVASNFVLLDRGYSRINIKLNGIVMTMVNGMGPKIPEKKVDELLARMDVVGAGDTLVLTGSIPNSLPEDMYMQIMRRLGGRGIQFVVDGNKKVYIIEVNPRSSRTVPFLQKTTGAPIADIATKVMLGFSLKELGYTGVFPKKHRWYVKAPTFSYSKLTGLDAVLSPEMKSTGEAIGYDDALTRAVYKALKASGLRVDNYGTVFATIGDKDKAAALPLIKRFYDLGFNIEATEGTAKYLKSAGIRTRVRKKLSQGSDEILQSLRKGYVTYVVNTITEGGSGHADGMEIRRTAVENNVPVFTSLDTVRVLLDVLEETTMGVSEI